VHRDIRVFSEPTKPVFSVSELNDLVQTVLEEEIGLISVRGEISNLATPSSGHIYFSLKDNKSQIRCAMFRNKPGAKGFRPENGLEVVAFGLTSVYTIRGDYQLIVDSLELSGDGLLRAKFEALQQKLEKAGLFDKDKKKPIPTWPKKIGIITSPSGAAIRDILTIIKRRCPTIPAIIYPCAVQGDLAAPEIARSILVANERNECDVLILGRGGGSLEDLWPFNEEVVAQSIFKSELPLVSGIGHEIDLTISDLVADLRAPTPSAAAELVTPDVEAASSQLKSFTKRLISSARLQISLNSQQASALSARIKHPKKDLEMRFQLTDDMLKQLIRKIEFYLQVRKLKYQHLTSRLRILSPRKQHLQTAERIAGLSDYLTNTIRIRVGEWVVKHHHLNSNLNNLGHERTLARGYSIVRDQSGKIITDSSRLTLKQTIRTTLHVGKVISTVKSTEPE